MNQALRFMKMLLSLLHSSAGEDETLDCHQIVAKAGAKRAKIGKLQKTEIRSICLASDFLDTELSVFMQQLRVQGAAGEPGRA
jgi:hypothetical protein